MKQLLTLYTLFVLFTVTAQNQGNVWHFGHHAGVDFSNGSPVAINGGQTFDSLGYSEGITALSDEDGNLLMYSNGETLWNKNHQVMLNGNDLFGNFSSTQSSIIIPQPNSRHIYYLFTVDDVWESSSSYGFRYSVIDLCEDNGNGMVLPELKNIPLLDSAYEKMGAVRHSNGRDFWIVTHKLNTNEYYSFLLDQNGVNNPVISAIGTSSSFGQGQLKFSPDGTKMAVAHNQHFVGDVQFELFDFDPSTGQISNPIGLSTTPYNVYGIEFSPNSSVLYAVYTRVTPTTVLKIVQFDISSGNATDINNSQTDVFQTNAATLRGLQIAPNGKIYMVAIPSTGYLLSINNPNTLGAGCNVVDNDVYLGGENGNMTLPTFVANYSYDNVNFTNCELSINELPEESKQVSLVKIVDLTGRQINYQTNTVMIYIYSNGTMERVFDME